MIPARYSNIVFGFFLTGMMSFIVSGVSVAFVLGVAPGFFEQWINGWLPSWAIAFPTVLVIAPLAQRIVEKVTAPE